MEVESLKECYKEFFCEGEKKKEAFWETETEYQEYMKKSVFLSEKWTGRLEKEVSIIQ